MKSIGQLSLFAIAIAWTATIAADEPSSAPENGPQLPSKEKLEQQFEQALSGATLSGHFTSGNDEKGSQPKEDKYTIESVSKISGDVWLFKARIQYGEHDLTLPLPLRVVWAGDTPVITLDKMPVPGLGTFSARVMMYDGKYAGMWDGGSHGGLLYGKIVKEKVKDK